MVNRFSMKSALIFIVILGVFSLMGCQGTRVAVEKGHPPDNPPRYEKGGPPPWAPAHGYRAKHNYRYYPDLRVYYDREARLYFFCEKGRWQASASLPGSIRIDAADSVTIELDTDKPYEYDNEVVKRYPPGQWKTKKGKKSR